MSKSKNTFFVSPKVYGQLKEKARKLKRFQKIKLHQAQEIVAREAKFDNWNQIAQVHKIAELFYHSFSKGLVIGLSRDGFYDQFISESCEKFYTQDGFSIIYQLGKEDIRNHHLKYEIDDNGNKEYFTESELDEFIIMTGMDVVFYAYNRKIDINHKMETIYSLIECLNGSLPRFLWFNGDYIDTDQLMENSEIQLRCSTIYDTYRKMSVGDEKLLTIYPSNPNLYEDLNHLKQLEKQKKVKITTQNENRLVWFMKLPDSSKVPTYPSLKKALQASKCLNDQNKTIVGVVYSSTNPYSPYQFFEVLFDSDENWYSVYFNGGHLWGDGSDGEDTSYGNESIDDLVSEVKEGWPEIDNIVFFETISMDFSLYAEEILVRLFHDLPSPDEYWPDRKQDYETLCINRINKVNHQYRG